MAQLSSKVDILARNSGNVISQVADGNQTISLNQLSIVRIHGTRDLVLNYERIGNDLVLHMKDGTTVRYRSFFLTDAEGRHSELVFDDGTHAPEHAVFAALGAPPAEPVALIPQYETIDNVGALVFDSNSFSPAALAAILGFVALGAGVTIASHNSGGGSGSNTETPGQPEEPSAPTITIRPFAGDNILNAAESQLQQVLSGTTDGVEAGRTIQITLNGKTYTTTVDAEGAWSLNLSAADLQTLADGTYVITVTVTNESGESAEQSVTMVVDTTPPILTINPVAGDDILDAAETGQPQIISGTASVSEAGKTVTVTMNGANYTATVGADGNWSLTIPAGVLSGLGNGGYSLTATLTDSAGNSTQITHDFTVDTTVETLPTLTLDAFTGDNVLDAAERQVQQPLSGSTTNVETGQFVLITLNGKTYSAEVQASGNWSINVPAADLALLVNGDTTISATVTDASGNPATASETLTVNTDLGGLSLDPISGDNRLNALEAGSELSVSGTSANVAEGATVTVTLNGKTYTAIVGDDGRWTATIPAADLALLPDGQLTVTATATDEGGTTVNGSAQLGVFITDLPEATLNPPFGDGILNGDETQTSQTLSGSTGVTGDGQTVTVNIGGQDYSGTVDGDGNWTISVPADVLQALPQGDNPLSVVVTDAAGNRDTLPAVVNVDTVAPTLIVNPVTGDGVINAAEAAGAIAITGSASLSEAGRTVTVTLNGQSYTGVVQDNGTWSVSVPAGALAGAENGSYPLTATLLDSAGNSTEVTQNVTLDADPASLPTLTLNAFAGDNLLNGAEQQTAQPLSGSTTNVEAGQFVLITLNGKTYSAEVQASGNWTINVPAADLALLVNGDTTISATVTDASGNPATASETLTVNTDLGGLSLDPISGDNRLNALEAGSELSVSGTSANVAEGATVTVTLNGKTYTAIVGDDGRWTATIPAADLALLPDGQLTVTATATDEGGTTVNGSAQLGVFITDLPEATLNPPFGDGILNGDETQTSQTLSGSTGVTGDGQTVTVNIGGQDYSGTVDGDGNWTISVPADVLQALPQGDNPLSVVVTDAAGNRDTLPAVVNVDTVAPTLIVNPVTGDGVINAAEAAGAIAITGSASLSEAGRTVTVTLNGQSYTGVVQDNGTWSVSVPAGALAGAENGSYPLTATLSDAAGNSTEVTQNVTLDADPASLPTLTLNAFAGDNLLNGAEQQTAQPLSGSTTNVEAGQFVLITLNGKTYSAEVQASGNWSINVPAADLALLVNGDTTISATVTDTAGNPATASETLTVNTELGGLSLDPISGDNRLNALEAGSELSVSGTSANVAEGATVTVTLNGKTYTATVGDDGRWTATIPAADLALLPDGQLPVTATATDEGGTEVNGSAQLGVFISELPEATLNPPFGDGILNGDETQTSQTLSGSTGVSGDGQTVTVNIGGQDYSGTVDSNGNWTVSIPADVLQALPQGDNPVEVTVTDAAGNSNTLDSSVNVDTIAPTLIVNPVTGDGVINAAEAAAAIAITGTASLSEAGRTVTVTLNGQSYTGVVQDNGTWSVSVPAGALSGVENGSYPLTATLSDTAGNETSVSQNVVLDVDPAFLPTLTLNAFAGDNLLNGAEQQTAQPLSGSTTNVEAGQFVLITLNGKTYSAEVQASGNWSISVPAADLALLVNGDTTISATVTDASGNPAAASETLTVNTDLGGLSLDPISGDNRLNALEAGSELSVSGTSANVAEGAVVTVTLNGKTYTATVGDDGRWTVTIPTADLALLPDGQLTVTATATDEGGTVVNGSAQLGVFISELPEATLNPPFGDGILNGEETQTSQTLSGSTGVSGDSQTVTVTIGGQDYSGTVDSNGNWTVSIPADVLQSLPQGDNPLSVVVTDAAGNSNTLDSSVNVDTIAPTLIVNPVTGDGVINAAEAAAAIAITGTASLSEAGRTVTVTLNGQSYTGVVQDNGTWSVSVPVGALSGVENGSYPLTATLSDSAGNSTEVTQTVTLDADPASLPTLTLNAFAGDNLLNGAEQQNAQPLSGSTTNVEAGQFVLITLNGKTYSAEVQASGNWSINVPAADLALLVNGDTTISATVTDTAGNPATASEVLTVNTDLGGLSLDPISGDNRLNALEAGSDLPVSGTSVNVAEGAMVTVTLNGKTYTATVGDDGRWTATIPAADLALLPDGQLTVTATATDEGGTVVNGSAQLGVFITDLPEATLNPPFGDGILNSEETQTAQTLSGNTGVTGDGQTVTVTIGGQDYSGTVDSNGNWTVTVPADVLQALPQGDNPLSVVVTDAAGNSNTLDSSVNVDTVAPTLLINPVTGDGVINAAEAAAAIAITGSASISEAGRTVTVTLNGQSYTGVVQDNGTWSVTVPAGALAGAENGSYPLTATLSDTAGNETSVSQNVLLDVDPASLPTLTLNAFAGDNLLNGAEQQTAQPLSGSTTNVEAGQFVLITLNGKTYSAEVQASGNWTINVPAADLALLVNGDTTISATVTDTAGNPATASETLTVDTELGGLSLDPISGDNRLNALEAGSDLSVSGTSVNVAEGAMVTVTLNGKTYTATVGDDGRWTATIPAADLALLPDGQLTVTATATDEGGTVVNGSAQLGVFISELPEATLNPPFGDGILNGEETQTPQTLSGSTGVSGDGQTVTVNIGGQDYSGTVDSNGNWTVTVPADVLQALPQGDNALSVVVTDAAGNTNTLDSSVNVDTIAPTLLINPVTGDGVINAAEAAAAIAITGSASITEAGRTVTVTLNGQSYTGVVQDNGTWGVSVPAGALAGVANGSYPLTATLSDAAGNSTEVTQNVTLDADPASLPTLTLNAFAGDNLLNGAEQQTAQPLSGSTTNVEAGQFVLITLNGKTYSAEVQASGNWSINVPAADLALLANGDTTISATVTDTAGNPATASETLTVNTDLGGLSLDPISGDNRLNALEAGSDLSVSGTSANVAEGAMVTVTLNGKTYTATVGDDGRWTATIPAADLALLPDGQLTVTATATDEGGTVVNGSAQLGVFITDLPEATLNPPFGDGILNGEETQTPQTLSGSTGVTGDGQTVTVTIGGQDYSGTVDSNGNWTVSIPADVLQALSQGDNPVEVTVTDAAGNSNTLDSSVNVDTIAPTLIVNPVTGDGVINAAEAAAAIAITGTASLSEVGRTVTVTLNGQSYTGVVQDNGTWSVAVPAGALAGLGDGEHTLTATLTDVAGNLASTDLTFDSVINGVPVPVINIPFGDSYLNMNESQQDEQITGSTGVTGVGQAVVVTLNGQEYEATVDANGQWQVTVPTEALQVLPAGAQSINVVATDAAGNVGNSSIQITVDLIAPTLSIGVIAGDDVINAAEILQPVIINGTASVTEAGQNVEITFNGGTYQALVQPNGDWSFTLPGNVLQSLADGGYQLSATLIDQAGNATTQIHDFIIDANAANLPTLSIGVVSGDDYINAQESSQPLTISGTSTGLEVGRTVTVTLNGLDYTATLVTGGGWSLSVPADAVSALPDGAQTIAANASDASGNPASANHQVMVIAAPADQPQLTIGVVAGDDIINAQESESAVTISGSTQRVAEGQTVTVTLNNKTYTGEVQANGSWSVTVPSGDVGQLPQGQNTITATVDDVAQNPANATHNVQVDTVAPLLEVDVLAGDGILNLAEALLGLVVGGTCEAGLTVTVTLNDKAYTATANNSGEWSLTIPSGDLLLLSDDPVQVGVSVTDTAGNTTEQVLDLAVAINVLPVLQFGTLFADGLLNEAEALAAGVISGTSNLALGTAVEVHIGDLTFTGTVAAGGVWSVNIPAGELSVLPDGALQVSVNAVDAAGNLGSASANLDVLINNLPTVTINQPFGDGLLNALEAGVNQILTGTTGITGAGQTMTLTIGDLTIAPTVGLDGNWQATLTPLQLLALGDGSHTISVTVTDRAGNEDTNTLAFSAIVDNLPAPQINLAFTDGIINAAEALAGGVLSGITGATGAGQRVSVNINGTGYQATVEVNGDWSLELPASVLTTLADGVWPVTVTVTDSVGNTAGTTGSLEVLINNLPDPAINLPFGDGVLNFLEALAGQTLSGVTGITGAGQQVTVSIDGQTPIAATVLDNGSWTLALTDIQLRALIGTDHQFTVTVTDRAGNEESVDLPFTSLQQLPIPQITLPFVDGLLNIAEVNAPTVISGVTGIIGNNQDVKLSIDVGGIQYTAIVAPDGSWSLALPAGALAYLTDGQHSINVTATDIAGNTGTASLNFDSLLTLPTPTIALPFTDGFLNAVEAAAGTTLQGTTGLIGAGQVVTITLGSNSYEATVDTQGNWSLPVTGGILSALTDGSQSIGVDVTDRAGNSAGTSVQVDVAVHNLPTVTLNDFAGDNILNFAEANLTQLISGTTTNVQVGQNVNITLGTLTLTAQVQGNGTWSVAVTPLQLAQLTGSPTLSVSVTDRAGNTDTDSQGITLNVTPPATSLTIDPISGDNIINASDTGLTVAVSGTVTGATPGLQTIVLLVNGLPTGISLPIIGNTWTTTLPAALFADGTVSVTAQLAGVGTPANANVSVLVDRELPTLTLNNFAVDNTVNNLESKVTQLVSGVASTEDIGRTVTVTLEGKNYFATVQAGGIWSVGIPATDLQALTQGAHQIVASLSDAAGNSVQQTLPIVIDTVAPLLSIDVLAGNNVLNLAEAILGQVLTGSAPGAEGQTITVNLGVKVLTAVVQPNGTWSVNLLPDDLQALADGPLVVGVTVADTAGNETSANLTLNIALNTALGLVVNPLFGDGFLNAAESLVSQTITGIAQNAGVGAQVKVNVAGTELTADVGTGGVWSLVVPPNLLALLNNGLLQLDVSLTDGNGNQVSQLVDLNVLTHNLPIIGALNPIFGGDGLLNATEALLTQTVGGVIQNVAPGAQVTVTLGTKTYTTTVQAGGVWNLDIPPLDLGALLDGNLNLGVSVKDAAGNIVSTNVGVGVYVHDLPQISLNPIFGDGILNATDLLLNQTITGTVRNALAGTIVSIGIGDSTITAIVDPSGHFTAQVAPDILGTLVSGNLTVSATVTDPAGNTNFAFGGVLVDVSLPTIQLNPLFGDGLLNAADALTTQVIGGVIGNVAAGTQVSVTLGGKTFLATTAANGAFSVTLQPADLAALLDGPLNVGVAVTSNTSNTGNVASASVSANVIIHNLPTLVLDPLFGGDGYLNAAEALLTQTISGTVTNAVAGTVVNISVGNSNLTATVGANGKFTAAVSADLLGTLLDGNLTVSASITDPVGNKAGASAGVVVDIHSLPSLVLNPIFGDGILSVVDLLTAQTISGVANNVPTGTQIAVTLGSHSYTATVGGGGVWSLSVPTLDLKSLLDGNFTVSAAVTDPAGNSTTQQGSFNVIANALPTLTLNPIFGDGLLNAADALLNQTISGTSTNAQGSTVRVTLGSQVLNATVQSDGTWSLSVPPLTLAALTDGNLTVGASLTNAAGHTAGASLGVDVGIHNLPSLSLGNFFATDGWLNLSEAGSAQTVSGTALNAAGGTIQVTLGTHTYTTQVNGSGGWNVSIPSLDLTGVLDGVSKIGVKVTDLVGNSSSQQVDFSVKTHALPLLGINPVTSLGNLLLLPVNGLVVSGSSLNVQQGAKVSVTLLGNTLLGTVQANGDWSVKFVGNFLSNLNLLNLLSTLIAASVTDLAGNGVSVSVGLGAGSPLPAQTLATSEMLSTESLMTADTASVVQHAQVAHTIAEVRSDVSESSVVTSAFTESDLSSQQTTPAESTLTAPLVQPEITAPDATASGTEITDTVYSIGGITVQLDAGVVDGVAIGGSGNDVIEAFTTDFLHIDGGAGLDTLMLAGTHQTLDLTSLGLKVENIEIFDLGKTGTNSLVLNLHEALTITDKPEDDLIIKGADGNQVTLTGNNESTWSTTGQREIDGLTFDVYHNSSLDSANTLGDVLVQHGIQVHLV
ncbi:Ig-like domain-containing protein [Edaphovirga cremea]|uniref:Ig-like domain-containing protein n=1 Tax=Edaphovirga cremea TaxID=2267246 RepID=UPI000DEFFC73|nr:Ig-like domain-containing protein [Edaphovirga cremea]